MTETDVRSTTGAVDHTFSELATVWAHITYPSRTQKENIDGGRETSFQEVHFDIRYRNDTDHVTQVVFNGNEYDVISIKEVGRKQALVLVTTWRDGDAA